MALRIEFQNGTAVVSIVGQLLTDNRAAFKTRVLDELAKGCRRFIIDLRETGYIDSSGLGALVTAAKKIREAGGELWVANPNNDVRTLFELTKLDLVLPELSEGDGGVRAGSSPSPTAPPTRPTTPAQGTLELPDAR